MAAAPYILARTFTESHIFARRALGLSHGQYRVVTSASTLKSVRGADLHLAPGWKKRFDNFPMKDAIRWTRMNVIDHELDEVPVVPYDLEPAGEQTTIPVTADEAAAFLTDQHYPDDIDHPLDQPGPPQEDPFNGDGMISEGGPVTPEPEKPAKKRRKSRCKDCGNLHYKGDPCPEESLLPEGD